ncbi:MAG: hypothetical protein ACEQR6_00780 [Burkholderiaceae bacterium]
MNYAKSILFTIIISLVFNIRTNAAIIQLPEHFTITSSPFLDKIMSLPGLETRIFLSKKNEIIPLEGTILKMNGQELIRTNETLYILISQSGVIYQLEGKLNSSYSFHRIDATVNINYNIASNNFVWDKHIYSYGGYGFWKLNGHLREFNFLDKEWDIAPADNEIISNGYNWYSNKEGRVYVPYQSIVNAGIAGPESISGKKNYDSYYLDLASKKWIKLGSLNNNTRKLIIDNINNNLFTLDSGYIYLNQDVAYYFNFKANKIYKSKNSELNQFFLRRANSHDIFFYKDSIFNFSPESQTFSTKKLSLNYYFEVLSFPIWGLDDNYFYVIAFVVFILTVFSFSISVFNRSVDKKLEQSQLKILKSKSTNQAFVGTEVALISLLLRSSKKGMNIEINEINHVLGIKDKNIGLQKKVRSDMINAINEKYQFVTQTELPLISSVRKEDDKRFYEYFITATEIKSIERILEQN